MYERFFGLADEPFRLTPDPRYLYLSPKHAEALAHLRVGLTESSGFVCITGEVGTGKTTLVRAFLSELGPEVTAVYALVPPLSALDLLRRICRELGLSSSHQSQDELIEDLHAHLLAQQKVGRRCVIVLDEAQALSIELLEQLRLLLNLETETEKLLRIVLVGQPQLRKLLLDPALAQLNQRITLRWHLGPLSYRETVAYVAHRLAVASGGRAPPLFTPPALRFLHSVSGGIPRLVNMVASRGLLVAFVARRARVDRRSVVRAYREIQTVPLPGTLSPAAKAAWAVFGIAVGVSLVVFGTSQLDHLPFNGAIPQATGPAPSKVLAGDGASSSRQVEIARASEMVPSRDRPLERLPAKPAGVALVSAEELARRIADPDMDFGLRAALQALLAVWGSPPLQQDETASEEDLESVAWRRGLQVLRLTANQSMIRVLDLPAVLVLRLPGTERPRHATLTELDTSRAVLSRGGTSITAEADLLERFWSGQAYVFWRDFDGFAPRLARGARGVAVARLQTRLRRAGVLQEARTGLFDATTEASLRSFQSAHRLDPDGIVGPLTGIVLYGAAGELQPSLVIRRPVTP